MTDSMTLRAEDGDPVLALIAGVMHGGAIFVHVDRASLVPYAEAQFGLDLIFFINLLGVADEALELSWTNMPVAPL